MNDEEDDENDDDFEELVDEDGQTGTGDPLTCIHSFKKLVIEILETNELSQKRASKMEIIDFLSLLSAFNGKGIHFK